MVTSVKHNGPEVAVVPGQDPRVAARCHSHHGEVGQIDSCVNVSVGKIESERQLIVVGGFEPVDTIEQRPSEGNGGTGMPAGAK